ncbi:MAG: calcium/sodium antiporter [Patescibacteria group bacterium]|nr:calcium/sodium antiporter [Patescibacteria group bacterium]
MLILFFFVIGMVLLLKGADWLVDGSSALAKRLKISDIVIGLTVVAFGTSAPEFVVNLVSSWQGHTQLAIGNILGSNIANMLLILGVAGTIYPLTVKRQTIWKEIPFSLLAALVVWILANDVLLDHAGLSALSRIDGLILLCFFVIFLYYVVNVALSSKFEKADDIKSISLGKSFGLTLIGLIGLTLGGKLVVDQAVSMATALGISQSIIALTIVALGTSLPELLTSAIAAYKHKSDIAIGNVVGSNIFNIFWVLGVSAVIRPLPFDPASNIDVLVGVGASALLFAFMFIGKRHVLQRWQAGLFVALYMGYLAMVVGRL